ncbi:MAG: response regulator [Desulfobacterales bacterium]|nr:response regulator [Desulfobacterales bacterium]
MTKGVRGTVLAVDDDQAVLEYLADTLLPHGYRLLLAASGEEALRLAEKCCHKIDLLLTDVVMPGLSGNKLAEHFQDTYPDTKILFMSAYMCPSMGHQGVPGSEKAFLLKPFVPDTLLRKMKKLLA